MTIRTVTELLAVQEPIIRGWIAEQIGDNAASNDPGDQFEFEFSNLLDGQIIYYDDAALEWRNTIAIEVQPTDLITISSSGETLYIESNVMYVNPTDQTGAGLVKSINLGAAGSSQPAQVGDGVIVGFMVADDNADSGYFADLTTVILDPTTNSKDAYMMARVMVGNVITERMRWEGSGVRSPAMMALGPDAIVTLDRWLDVDGSLSFAAENFGILVSPSIGANQNIIAGYFRADVDDNFTAPEATAIRVKAARIGAGSAVTLAIGIELEEQTVGGTNYTLWYEPGSDKDMNILSVNVTTTPTIIWDESETAFDISSGLNVQGAMTVTGATTYDGVVVIDVTAAEAFLVRQNSDANDVFVVDTSGRDATLYGQFFIDGSADEIQLLVQANATQTTNLFVIEKSDGTDYSGADERGILFSHGGIDADSVYIGSNAGNIGHTNAIRNIGIGTGTLDALTTGDNNIAIGVDAMTTATTGSQNTVLGYLAGDALTTGSDNVLIGQQSGTDLTEGDANFGLGTTALQKVTTGNSNIAIGSAALNALVLGGNNTLIGPSAGSSGTFTHANGRNVGIGRRVLLGITGGRHNVGVGDQAGLSITSAEGCVFVGQDAGGKNTTAGQNIAIGADAGTQNVTGTGNTIVGFSAGTGVAANSYSKNTLFGYQAGTAVTTGGSNILVGWRAGNVITSGAANIIIGYDIDPTGATVSDELNIGDVLYGALNTNPNITINAATISANYDLMLAGDGVLGFKEGSAPTADATYGKLWTTDVNELFFQSGDGVTHLLHGDAFSNIWFHAASTVEVAIATQNAMTEIDSFTVVGNEDDLANVVGSSANNNLTLSSIAGGEYEISFHVSMTATGGADKEMVVALGITLATAKDITVVTDDTVTPIVITSTAHGLEDGDMVEIAGVLGNTAANGSFIVDSKTANTFEIVKLDGTATTGNGDFDEGSPTGDVTIEYPGNMIIHREVRGATLGAISATGIHVLANSDVLAVYVANLDGVTNLTVAAVSFDAFRIGD